jgi:hypothetical protein
MKVAQIVLMTAFAASGLWCSEAQARVIGSSSNTTTSTSTSSLATTTVIWSDSFESGNFNNWSFVQGADTTQGGPGPQYVYVTTPAAAGVPAEDGKYIAHFERPTTAVNYPHAKIYKEWSTYGKLDQFGRKEDPIFNNGSVSASYSAWYYFPANYTVPGEWVNIFQFKEQGYSQQGVWSQNPSWWVNISSASTWNLGNRQPYLFINNEGNNYVNFKPKVMPVPLGRWFQIIAKLYQGQRIDWYVDGKLFDTSYNSTWPVGRFYYNSNGWIFGVGHYGGYGTFFVDNVQVSTN